MSCNMLVAKPFSEKKCWFIVKWSPSNKIYSNWINVYFPVLFENGDHFCFDLILLRKVYFQQHRTNQIQTWDRAWVPSPNPCFFRTPCIDTSHSLIDCGNGLTGFCFKIDHFSGFVNYFDHPLNIHLQFPKMSLGIVESDPPQQK